jgi:hypothetical protein
VYTGNIAGEENSTRCLRCGAVLVHRRGYRVDTPLLRLPPGTPAPGPRPCRCVSCGTEVPVYW